MGELLAAVMRTGAWAAVSAEFRRKRGGSTVRGAGKPLLAAGERAAGTVCGSILRSGAAVSENALSERVSGRCAA